MAHRRVEKTRQPNAEGSQPSDSPQFKVKGEVAFGALTRWRNQQIARAAYFRAEARGFAPGHELDDWLEAEREVDWLHRQE